MPLGTEICPIHLPGRWERVREQPYESMRALVEALREAMHDALEVPFAFFGYSLGGLVAFELAREFRRCGWRSPECLWIGSCGAPQCVRVREPLGHLSEREFVRAVAERYSVPAVVLNDDELRAIAMRAMRADLRIVESYRYREESALSIPIFVFGGAGDRLVARESLEAWREQTDARFEIEVDQGGHFFTGPREARLVDGLRRTIEGLW